MPGSFEITATSRLGAGSTFVFTARLPAAPAAPDVPPVSEAVAPKPKRVLVAEDDEVNALIVTAFLDGLGIAHERVHDGRAAVGHGTSG